MEARGRHFFQKVEGKGVILTLLTSGTGFRALYRQEERHSGWYTYRNTWRNFVQNAALQGGIWIYPAPQGGILDFSTYKIPRHSGKNAALCVGTKPVQLVNNGFNAAPRAPGPARGPKAQGMDLAPEGWL